MKSQKKNCFRNEIKYTKQKKENEMNKKNSYVRRMRGGGRMSAPWIGTLVIAAWAVALLAVLLMGDRVSGARSGWFGAEDGFGGRAEVRPADVGDEDADEEDEEPARVLVTCGSVVKLRNVETRQRLHSHRIDYGSGSGQQSVTTVAAGDDPNSLWIVTASHRDRCRRGEPIVDGQVVRLRHVATGANLHSHDNHRSPLSDLQEVSGFGSAGIGDTGDDWVVLIDADADDNGLVHWHRDDYIRFKHFETGALLFSHARAFGHPIPGQHEVAAVPQPRRGSAWFAEEGFYFEPNDNAVDDDEEDEE